MNAFGTLFRISMLGESHGPCVGIVIDGCPAGLALTVGDFLADLDRRKGGRPGTTARREDDIPSLKSGLFKGVTTGAPLLILFENKDVDSTAYSHVTTNPRPGQADLTAQQKFGGFHDYRGGGIFSGRLTAGLVAAGVVAKKLILPATCEATLVEAGGSTDIDGAVKAAAREGDSVGGIVECRADGIPPGLGEPFFDSVESLLGHLVFAIPGIKGIEFGAGFACARMRGSACNDRIVSRTGETMTNNAGGINGGITNGNRLAFRIAVRPTASISRPQFFIDMETALQREFSLEGRHDACFALRVPVIVEAATAIVLADLMLLEQKIPRIRR
ncbi:MAG: chorismate synthase [Syntrophorhabdales bacterium]|jgi:chorismate synthase